MMLGVCPTCRGIGTMRAEDGVARRHDLPKKRRSWFDFYGQRRPGVFYNDTTQALPFDDETLDDADESLDDSSSLRISDSLALPAEYATQTGALLAKRGSGKTYLLGVMFEEFDRLSIPCLAIDPVGAMCGLAKLEDGEDSDARVFGGEHGEELPSGQAAADLATHIEEEDVGVPVVFDLSVLRRDDQVVWGAEFFETLYHLKSTSRSPLHLLVDEADVFAPQSASGEDNKTRCRNALEDVVRRGRLYGLGCTLATQRPSVLHKNVLSQTQVLFALRMTSPQDREAIDEWVRANGDDERRYQLMDSLATLEVGEAWVWSPGWGDLFRRVRVRRRRTVDSSATPDVVLRSGA
jgi:DNA helicase HerA-like ATPase